MDKLDTYLVDAVWLNKNTKKLMMLINKLVYRDGRNPTFWCSIGVLYYQINQYRYALDAYSRAIKLNPYLSEV
jgi:tetratricopeptide (TPR) repeat protein